MKKILTILLALFATINVMAEKANDANKAVVVVITKDAEGNILQKNYGFMLGPDGRLVAPYSAFNGAASATIINWQGQEASVKRIIGASSEYDLVYATTDVPTKKLINLERAASHATKGQAAQVAYYNTAKKSAPDTLTIKAADLYNEHYYYEVTTANEDTFFGCPIIDTEGHVFAVVQKNVQKDATTACAIDINFVETLNITSMSIFNSDLNAIRIPKLIPLASEEEAYSYIFMLLHSQQDEAIVIPATDDFIEAFPDNVKIYADRATFLAGLGKYAEADAALQQGIIKGGENLSDIYYTLSLLAYSKVLAGGDDTFPAWTLDAALDAAAKAYEAQALPVYLLQQGQVLFTQQKYQEAYEKFAAVNATETANSQTFYFAANALERAGGDDAEIIALLDSAVAHLAIPYTSEAAPYLLARAQHLDNHGEHRRAVRDYNEYEKIIGTLNLNAYFYYLRMQAEIGSRMYQQALDDAATAISRTVDAGEKADYLFEMACLQLQVGLTDESIQTCETLIGLNADYAEAYKILGVAYGEKKDKKKALQYLNSAKQKGADDIDALIEKYK